jgi:hypothetical protein
MALAVSPSENCSWEFNGEWIVSQEEVFDNVVSNPLFLCDFSQDNFSAFIRV